MLLVPAAAVPGPRRIELALFDLFRRKAPIRDIGDLADFIDGNAAFLMQKGIYEYSRVRAGHYAKVLLTESGFLAAVEESRWKAFPIGLAIVGEMVDGVLRNEAGEGRLEQLAALKRVVLAVLDRYPIPESIGQDSWREARDELALRLDHVGLHPPKRVIDIPEPYAERYFALMPIHKKLRGQDYFTTRNYLRVSLCNIHEELTKRIDAPGVAAQLRAMP